MIPRFEKSKAYLLPIVCGGFSLGWTVVSIFIIGRVGSSDLSNLSMDIFVSILSLAGPIAFFCGSVVGVLIYFGSKLRVSRRMLASAILIFISFILSKVSVSVIFFMLVLGATG